MSGQDNMAYDVETLRQMQDSSRPPVLRFFRWSKPGVSYGKHQSLDKLQALIPPDCEAVQRPTGGGLVFHGADLCLSLCWRQGQPPLSQRMQDQYAWIHQTISDALQALTEIRMARCGDSAPLVTPFATRECFTAPVAFDLLAGTQKIVGGALCRRRNVFLYQGSIQFVAPSLESLLSPYFQHRFNGQ